MRPLTQAGCVAALWFSLVLQCPVFAQSALPPEAAATAVIAGRVVSADGRVPIRGAVVRLSGGRDAQTEETGEDGVYEFAGLRPGRYSVICDKTGYLVVPRRRQAFERPVVSLVGLAALDVEVAAGEVRRDANITMERWAAIAVHVSDDLGNPRAGVEVRALAVRGVGAQREVIRAGAAAAGFPLFFFSREFRTDDRGDVRIYGVYPDDYVVVADPGQSPLTDADRDGHERIYAPTYYPGTPSVAEAKTLSIGAGDEATVRIALAPVRAAHVSGRVVRWNGTPGRTHVILSWNPAGPLYADNSISDTLLRMELVDGRFTFWNVRPGEYIIRTDYDPDSQERDGEGSVPLTVGAKDVSDVLITTKP